jgi:hypothetical protein
MRLRQLLERRISSSASGESLRPLSAPEVQQVAGAAYDGGPVIIVGPIPHPVFPPVYTAPPGISPRFVES